MPLWIGAYLADTSELTTVQHGAYMLLLMSYWRKRKALPDDDEKLRAITKTSPPDWKRMRPTLAEFFRVGDGVWWHKRVEAEMLEADKRASGASSKASKAAQARWGQSKSNAPSNAPSDAPSIASGNPQAVPEQCPPPTPSTPPLRSGAERATRLPKPFELPADWADWAKKERPDLEPSRVAEKFADYWHGKGGAAGRKLDWLATWRNWIREERGGPQARQPQGGGGRYAGAAAAIFDTTPDLEYIDV